MSNPSVTVIRSSRPVTVTQTINGVFVASPGPQGPPGPAGPPGGSFYAEEDFVTTSSVVFNHNLGSYPNITILIGGVVVEADVTHNSVNQVSVLFATPQTGKVVAS